MTHDRERRLLALATATAAALLVALLGSEPASAGGRDCVPGRLAPSRLTITQPRAGEQPLLVEGQVVHADGKTPAAEVVLYVFHTDASGRYSQQRGAPPRLRGRVRTDAQGRYAYRTIRPAPYPGGRDAAHVHTQLWSYEVPAQWGTTLLFADDPLLSITDRLRSATLGRFAYVCAPSRDAQGVQRCRHDLRLEKKGDDFEGHDRHGFVGAPGGIREAAAAGGWRAHRGER